METARLLYFQHAPSDVVLGALGADQDVEDGGGMLDLAQQERFWELVLNSDVARRHPVAWEVYHRLLRRYVRTIEDAGREVSESFLRAIVAGGGAASTRFGCPLAPTSRGSGHGGPSFASYGVPEVSAAAPLVHCRVASSWSDVGLVPWEAAFVLAEYCVLRPGLVAGRHVVELGAGLGITGLIAARYAAPHRVTLTDHSPAVLENAEATIAASGAFLSQPLRARAWTRGGAAPPHPMGGGYAPCPVAVAELDWRAFAAADVRGLNADVWLAADVMYAPELARPLAAVLAAALLPVAGEGDVAPASGAEAGARKAPTAPATAVAAAAEPGLAGDVAADHARGKPGRLSVGQGREGPFRHVVPWRYETCEGAGQAPPPPARRADARAPMALVACTQRNASTLAVFLREVAAAGLQAEELSQELHGELGLAPGSGPPRCKLFHYANGAAVRVFRVTAPQLAVRAAEL